MRRSIQDTIGRAWGTTGWDPLDYAQWTRQLVVRPLVLSLWISVPLIVGVTVGYALGFRDAVVIGIAVALSLAGCVLGAWVWASREKRRP
jgi:hypothetical protein